MRDYGKVYSTFWSSATTSGMSDDGKLLALYMMTCSHNTIAGVFRLPDGYVSEDLGWEVARVRATLVELFDKGFAKRCETTKWVWVVKHLEWNPPENPNQRKSAVKIARGVPQQCVWQPLFMLVCGPLIGIETNPGDDGSGTLAERLLNQEQKQEQKQDQKQDQDGAAQQPPAAGAAPTPPAAPMPPLVKAERGARLPKDWQLPRTWGEAALADYPFWTADKVRLEADKFRDHWVSKSGKDATKLDWEATWRNWYRSDIAHRDDAALKRTAEAARTRHEQTDAEALRLLGHNPNDLIGV